jgi:hypothetical protein
MLLLDAPVSDTYILIRNGYVTRIFLIILTSTIYDQAVIKLDKCPPYVTDSVKSKSYEYQSLNS